MNETATNEQKATDESGWRPLPEGPPPSEAQENRDKGLGVQPTPAFVLSGGASKGDFQVGALDYLYHVKHIRPSIICGASVGSVNAFGLATDKERGIILVKQFWLNLKYTTDMIVTEPWVDQAKTALLGNTIGANVSMFETELAMAFAFPLGFIPLLLHLSNAKSEISGLLQLFRTIMRSKNVYNLSPVADHLKKANGGGAEQQVSASGIALRLACTCLETGELTFVDENGNLLGSDNQVSSLIDAVIASSGIPLLFNPTRLGDKWYVDGGVTNVLPIQAAIDAGATEVYAIEVDKPQMDAVGSFSDKGLLDIGYRGIAQIMPHAIVVDDTQLQESWKSKVTIIRPSMETHDAMIVDPGCTRISMAYGYMRAYDMLDSYQAQRADAIESSDEITKLRFDIWEWEHFANKKQYLNFASQPAAVSWSGGNASFRLDIFARGSDDRLWHNWKDGYPGVWGFWESLEGKLTSAPAVASWASDRLDVFARGLDNSIIHKAYENGWADWDNIGGRASSAPAAVSWGPGRIDVFVGGLDRAVWHRAYDKTNPAWQANSLAYWSEWESLGSPGGHDLLFDPAVSSSGPGRLDLYAVGDDERMYHQWFENGQWSGWTDDVAGDGKFGSSPAAASWAPGRLDVFGLGTDGLLYHRWWWDGNWSNESNYIGLHSDAIAGGAVAGALLPIPGGPLFGGLVGEAINVRDWEQIGMTGASDGFSTAPGVVTYASGYLDVFAIEPNSSTPPELGGLLGTGLLGNPNNGLIFLQGHTPQFGDGRIRFWDDTWQGSGPLAPYPINSWKEFRQMKGQLRDLVAQRKDKGWAVPPDANDWWNYWERHSWDDIPQNPWENVGDPLPKSSPTLGTPWDPGTRDGQSMPAGTPPAEVVLTIGDAIVRAA